MLLVHGRTRRHRRQHLNPWLCQRPPLLWQQIFRWLRVGKWGFCLKLNTNPGVRRVHWGRFYHDIHGNELWNGTTPWTLPHRATHIFPHQDAQHEVHSDEDSSPRRLQCIGVFQDGVLCNQHLLPIRPQGMHLWRQLDQMVQGHLDLWTHQLSWEELRGIRVLWLSPSHI